MTNHCTAILSESLSKPIDNKNQTCDSLSQIEQT